jgi:UDPglucose--hexose-1-phosphate uridylyltransferase
MPHFVRPVANERDALQDRLRAPHRAPRRHLPTPLTSVASVVTVTRTKLADGRELIYYDEEPGRDRSLPDPRSLPESTTASEIRRDPLLDEWVIVASHRQARTHLPPATQCPLCPSTPERQTEIPAADYDVVVFENRFPSLAENLPAVPPIVDDPLYPRRPGIGRCEVVCFTSDHTASFADLPPSRMRTVLEAWIDRTGELSALPGVAQVFCFENRGEEIGVTLHHPHGQVYAYPFVTPRTARMMESVRGHHETTGRNLFDDILEAESRAGTRIVRQTDHWTAFVPAAARWPYEVHLYPNRRVPDLTSLTESERTDLCPIYLDLLRRFDALFRTRLPYIAAWHQAPSDPTIRESFATHLELFSIRRSPEKLKYLAGSESAMGVFINDIAPEDAAERLREVGT